MLRKIVQGLALVGVVTGMGAMGGGCLDRDVVGNKPTVSTNFTNAVSQSGINKVDILFDIDNSASMGDKQAYLIQAIPDMISRLITPRCVDAMGNPTGANADPMGACPAGMGSAEFAPVHDMHIGVVTSALGSRLGVASGSGSTATYVCDPANTIQDKAGYTVSEYNDDQGHLINRASPNGSGTALSDANPGNFLYWFPPNVGGNSGAGMPGAVPLGTAGSAPAGSTTYPPNTLNGDFQELVGGAGQSGCGIESQLESWYRFLIQPDPYASLALGSGGGAEWVGVDATIIQQRSEFLRPDSLVAIIVLTDENDSEIDVRSYQGTGYNFMSQTWPPPHGTSGCDSNPPDSTCTSCGFSGHASDPNCAAGGGTYTNNSDWGSNLNLRHVHMLQKYGLNPQYPLTRYYNGLTSKSVPNRNGEYPAGAGSYVGNNNCVNPLFAASLPNMSAASVANIDGALCQLTTGARSPEDVFFAHIGGVPHELLQGTPGGADGSCPAGTAQADCPQKNQLAPTDWVKILGQGAAAYVPPFPAFSYDYTGIDPHMIESEYPRQLLGTAAAAGGGIAVTSNPAVTAPVSANGLPGGLAPATFATSPFVDPINGREWTTNVGNHSLPVDREYACVFQLPIASQRDCSTLGSLSMSTIEYNSCDCTGTDDTPDQVPPLCAQHSSDGTTITSSLTRASTDAFQPGQPDYTVQVYAKAYPTIRELTLANMMGTQGIVSSLCPIHPVDNAAGDDPLYGYRPAVNAIVNRLKSALAAQCVPKLVPDPTTNQVPCLILVTFPKSTAITQDSCASFGTPPGAYAGPGSTILSQSVLDQFQTQQHATFVLAGDAGPNAVDPSTEVTCALANQIPASQNSCAGNTTPGWCYETNSTACASTGGDALVFTSNFIPNGATVSLQCIAANSAATGDGG